MNTVPSPGITILDWIPSAVIGEAKLTTGFVRASADTSIESTCAPPPAASQARVTDELHPVRDTDSNMADRASADVRKGFNFPVIKS